MPPASEKTRMRLASSIKAWVSPRLAEPARFSTTRRAIPSDPVLRMARRERPVTSATGCPKTLDDLVERSMHRRQRGELFDQPVAPRHGVAALHRLSLVKHRPRGQIAFAVGERLV